MQTTPGVFYNGRQYVSMDGERSAWHPNMDDFIAQWLDEQNQLALPAHSPVVEPEPVHHHAARLWMTGAQVRRVLPRPPAGAPGKQHRPRPHIPNTAPVPADSTAS